MNFLGIDIPSKNTPALDPGFLPMSLFCGDIDAEKSHDSLPILSLISLLNL